MVPRLGKTKYLTTTCSHRATSAANVPTTPVIPFSLGNYLFGDGLLGNYLFGDGLLDNRLLDHWLRRLLHDWRNLLRCNDDLLYCYRRLLCCSSHSHLLC